MKAVDDLLNDHQKDEHKQISQDHLNAALLEACRAGWKFFVHKLVRSGATVCNEQNKNCTTALHIAAQHGFQDIVNFLLHKGADVNAVDENLNTALILAVNPAGCTEMLVMLLAHGAEIDAQNSEGMTALMKAVEEWDIDAITILLLVSADENKRNVKGHTSKDIAMDSGISDVFEFIKCGDKKIRTLFFSKSALKKAVLENYIDAVKVFVDCVHRDTTVLFKCNTDYERENCETLNELVHSICVAARSQKKLEEIQFEIAKGFLESITCKGKKGELNLTSLLKKATQDGLYELVEILCKYEDFERYSDTTDHTALVIAAEKGWTDILKLLLSFTPVPSDTCYSGDSALFAALKKDRIDCADILLQKRCHSKTFLYEIANRLITNDLHKALTQLVFHLNDEELTQSLLSQAVQHGRVETVQVLINRGADVNVRHDGGKVVLVVALECLEGSQLFKMVKFLVENGAHVNRSLPDKSPLVCAVWKGPEIVRYLLEKGADINEVGDEKGNTPLMATVILSSFSWQFFDRFNLVQLLLDFGADPNIVNSEGDTAINVAVGGQKLDVVSKLLDAGADLEMPDSDGRTPLLLAAARGQENIIYLLKRHGANMATLDNDGNTALSLVLQTSRLPTEKTLRLLAQDKDMINKPRRDGLTPLMLAAQNADSDAIKILLELGADPNILNNIRGEACTALSIVLDHIDKPRALPCVEELIKHNGLASMPRRCYLALLKMIVRDQRQMVQLMVTRGMAPLCVDVKSAGATDDFILGVNDSLKQNLSPLATALLSNRLAIANYLINNWFLTPVDVVGSPLLRELRRALRSSSRAACRSFMDEHLSQPMSLVKLSFVAVSAALGEPAGREERVRNTPLPATIQDKLLFRH
ncbi:serine/threonine-protein phosphatase 6 regulatory ankyrin repeat subunit b [Plakobranchus ocellatus]|uniref:Serine/threonine-protein phosphatase 6 regulatory ankyrin repeat subunit b n=1 Tax=Plakobranchus ocellatus TaxID=259542 RepID=A0AAV4BYR8_9GAST|nr:serine/threonine-protein phosphatase 6 regulatory ankyrin repeat subunit b [Plakobranchus ocellatus]